MTSRPATRTCRRATHRDEVPVDPRGDALELFGALIDAMPDAIVVVDETSTIVLINDQTERLFAYRRQELLGQPVDILVPERFRSAHGTHRAGYFRAASLRPMGSGMDLSAVRRDGQEFPVEISLSPLDTRMGALVICAIRDVTLQRRAQRAAERAAMADVREANEHLVTQTVRAQVVAEEAEQDSHLKDEFLATMSHELRTPLNAILGWARMLGSKRLSPERAEHATAAIERSAATLAHMVDDLLDVARIVNGALRLSPEPVDLRAVVQTALEAVRPLAAARNLQLEFDVAGHHAVVGDAGRLQQVIGNLLANAIKFTPDGGRISVAIDSSPDHVEIRVADSGQGISPDFLPHLFERFRQADNATTQRHTGLGLGLHIVRQLVELHGGTVRAESPGAGQGTTLTVRLPVSSDDAVADAEPLSTPRVVPSTTATASSGLTRLDGLRILIVDDDAEGRLLTSVVVTEAGGSTWVVPSVGEALQLIERERPDVIVSGIDLPGEDGYALIRRIRQLETVHGGFLPAVALTSHARVEDRGRALASGFQLHVPKPVEPATLIAAIAALTGRLDRRDSQTLFGSPEAERAAV
ncbi:MAG TPA: ATP-binding protein [Vicinamibacterales bacterium]|nr:ATP-binding protein [Vicinamibacterales bacterium]